MPMPGTENTSPQVHRDTLSAIIDFCNRLWVEAHQAEAATAPPSNEHAIRKQAFDEVMSHARALRDARPREETAIHHWRTNAKY